MGTIPITDEQRIALLANDRESLETRGFDPLPEITLYTPDSCAAWRLTKIDPYDRAHAIACVAWAWRRRKSAGSAWRAGGVRGWQGSPVERDSYF